MSPRTRRWMQIIGWACLFYGLGFPTACQQPFGFAPGQKTICPPGSHPVYVKDGIRCVQDSTTDSMP